MHGGDGWGTSDWNFPPHSPTAGGAWSPFATGGAFSQNPSGGILGGHVGYNVQVGNWVFGPEASIAWSELKATSTDPLAASLGALGTTYESKLTWLATTTARLGYAPANWLIYAKGGLAAAQAESTMTFVATPPAFSFHERNAYVGWTVGAGVEYALNTNWIAGLEYNYVNLGKEHYGGNIPLGGGLVASQTDYEVGVKFQHDPGPRLVQVRSSRGRCEVLKLQLKPAQQHQPGLVPGFRLAEQPTMAANKTAYRTSFEATIDRILRSIVASNEIRYTVLFAEHFWLLL